MRVAITQEGKLFPTGITRHHIRIFCLIPSSHPPFLRSKALSTTSLHLSLCLSLFFPHLSLHFTISMVFLDIYSLSFYLFITLSLAPMDSEHIQYQQKCQGAENPRVKLLWSSDCCPQCYEKSDFFCVLK